MRLFHPFNRIPHMMSPALAAVWEEGVSPESELVRMRRGDPEAFEELLNR